MSSAEKLVSWALVSWAEAKNSFRETRFVSRSKKLVSWAISRVSWAKVLTSLLTRLVSTDYWWLCRENKKTLTIKSFKLICSRVLISFREHSFREQSKKTRFVNTRLVSTRFVSRGRKLVSWALVSWAEAEKAFYVLRKKNEKTSLKSSSFLQKKIKLKPVLTSIF